MNIFEIVHGSSTLSLCPFHLTLQYLRLHTHLHTHLCTAYSWLAWWDMSYNCFDDSYKLLANVCCKAVSFEVGDFLITCLQHELWPKYSFTTLQARAMGPSHIINKLGSIAYIPDLPVKLGISSIFKGILEPPCLPFGATRVPKLPFCPHPHTNMGWVGWLVCGIFQW